MMIKNNKKFKISALKKLKSGKIIKRYTSSLIKMKKWILGQNFKSIIITCKWDEGKNSAVYSTKKDAIFFINQNYDDYKYYKDR